MGAPVHDTFASIPWLRPPPVLDAACIWLASRLGTPLMTVKT